MREYKMTYYSGGGTAYDGGLWLLTKRPKTIRFDCTDEPFYESSMPSNVVVKTDNSGKHCIKDWGDDSYTVYPNHNGVPHVFEPAHLATIFRDDDIEDDLL